MTKMVKVPDWLGNIVPKSWRPSGRQKSAPMAWLNWRQSRPEWHLIDYESYVAEGFNLNSIIYSAIMYKVKAMISAPLRAYEGERDQREQLPDDHPLSLMIARPNEYQDWIAFHSCNIAFLNIAGNCYIYKERGPNEEVVRLWTLRPDRVYIVPGDSTSEQKVLGFYYVPPGTPKDKGVPLLWEDVAHIKFPNPGDPLGGLGYGMSPISPGAHSTDVDNSVTKFLRHFFENGTMLQGLLTFNTSMSQKEVDSARARWREVYGGWENWDEIGIMDNGGTYQRITPTFAEMGFGMIDERNESRILGPFGVPPVLIGTRTGLERSTYSNYEQAKVQFWEDTMVPESMLFESALQRALGGEGLFVGFDYSAVRALQQNTAELVESWVKLVTNGVPKDIASGIVGLNIPPLPDGRVVYMPTGLRPVGQLEAEGEEEEPEDPSREESGLERALFGSHVETWEGYP